MQIIFYTDGASRGNPGRGGWGVYVEIERDGKKQDFKLSGGSLHTTNNRMELTALIHALMFLEQFVLNKYFVKSENIPKTLKIIIKLDSRYVKDGILTWILNWEKNNWRNANRKEVLNRDLWERLLKLKNSTNQKLFSYKIDEIKFEYVAGHAGIEGNEIADKLATSAADNQKDK